MNKTKIGFVSLGCPKNQIDTEVMLHELMTAGYEITGEDIEADIIIVNTCAFIADAKQEAIDNILDVAWLKENRSLKGIIVTGCLAQRYPEQIRAELPEVDAIVGTGSIHDIVDAVKAVEAGQSFTSLKPNESCKLGGDRILTTGDAYAYLKIAEGCDNRCTYCAIPAIRGAFRSRPMEDIIEEAKGLGETGIKELVLVAQDTTRYGLDLYGDYKLAELLHRLSEETTIPWLRILYCYPDKITDGLVREMAENDRVVKYIDLPIQHINDTILTAMNRHGGSAVIKDAVRRLREGVPGITIRTTAIVGFPGETQEAFEELCEYVKEAKFDRFGAFPYSQEEGTVAAALPDQLEDQVKQDRYDMIMRLQNEIHESLNRQKLRTTVDVLCEGFDAVSEAHYGRSAADAPEIDGKIYFSASRRVNEGEMVKVRITEVVDYDLYGIAKFPKNREESAT